MKRIAALILSAVLLAASLSACGRKEDGIVKDSPTPTHTVEEDIVEPIESMLPYEKKLNSMLAGFLTSGVEVNSSLAQEREVHRVALVAVTSNGSLCGAFNANVIKRLQARIEEYQTLGSENILLYPIGKKVEKEQLISLKN